MNDRISHHLAGGLSGPRIRDMHDKAMTLIEEIGLEVEHEGVRARLADFAGVRIDGAMVRFDRALVEEKLRAYPCDIKYGSFVYGSPEDALATMLQVSLNRHYGIPVVAKCLLTTAKEPDAHAAAEKSAHTMAALLAGVDAAFA